ncbi:MAG: hypothetical protein R3F46_01440 [bacterium]
MTILMLAGCAGAGSPADSGPQDQLSSSAPAIIAVEGAGSDSLSVSISDSDQAGYSLQVAVPDGMSTDTRQLSLVSGMGNPVELHFRSSDIFAAVSGEAVISITRDAQVLESRRVMVQSPALQLEDDTLYAIPLQTEAAVGEAVRVLIATGDLTQSGLTSINTELRVDGAWNYVADSFNLGEPGGARLDPDGFWEGIVSQKQTWLLGADEAGIQPTYFDPAGSEYSRLSILLGMTDFSIGPISEGGVVYSFQLSFDEPGTYTLDFNDVVGKTLRTYYNNAVEDIEGNALVPTNHFWADISNQHDGLPNSITVN